MSYVNPGWHDEAAPAINAEHLNALSNEVARLSELTSDYSTVRTNASNASSDAARLKTGAIVARNVSVPVSAWVSDSTYSAAGYPLKATITVAGNTTDHIPFVCFGMTDAIGGNFAPVAVSGTSTVSIWCKVKPGSAITLASVTCIKQIS